MDRSSTTIMAAVSSSAALAPLSSPSGINNLSYRSSLLVPFFIAASPKQSKFRPSTVVFSSYKSRNGMVSDSKRELLESYGLDPDEFLAPPSSSSKSRRRKEAEGTGGRTRNSPEQHTPRTTHKLLQVLGGKARRKKLLSPKGMDVRPMMEVVKGSAFDILQAAGGCPASLRPGRWLDLYSGTGSVGIEAISRGCSEVHFVEMDPWVVSDVLRPNLEWTGFLDVSMIHTVRVENFLERAEQFVDKNGQFDYISVTPPYTSVDYSTLMGQLSSSALLGENTFIVVEYPLRTAMLDSCGSLVKIADRRFGRTHLAIYGPTWAQKKKKSKNSVATVAAMAP